MKKVYKNLFITILFLPLLSCNNNQQGNIEDEEGQDIRIEGHQKQTASDNAYPENAVGDYLKYISESSSASYPTPKKSLKLLAEAIVDKNKAAGITSNKELQNLAVIDLTTGYNISKSDYKVISQAFKESFSSGSFEGAPDIGELEETVDEMKLEQNKKELGTETKDFFEKAGEILRQMSIKGG